MSTQIGIDIGSYSIKVVKLSRASFGVKRKLAFDIQALPEENSTKEISKVLTSCLKNVKANLSKANISISGNKVVYRFIHLPVMKKAELIESIKLEWNKFISLKIEDVMWDFQILDTVKTPSGTNQNLILLISAEKNLIEKKIKLIQTIGLSPKIISVDSLCVLKTFKYLSPPTPKKYSIITLLNIGETYSNLIVLKSGVCRLCRDIFFGGVDIRKMIAQGNNISPENAEKIKCNIDETNTKNIDFLNMSFKVLIDELKLSFEYLKREMEMEKGIETIYITGGTSQLYNIEALLSTALNVEVKILSYNYFSNVEKKFELEKNYSEELYKNSFPQLLLASGLALYK